MFKHIMIHNMLRMKVKRITTKVLICLKILIYITTFKIEQIKKHIVTRLKSNFLILQKECNYM